MDAAIAGVDKPVIGNRHAVGVAAEISEDVFGPREGGLTVDDPGLGTECLEPRGERRGRGERGQTPGEMEVAPVEGPPQTGEIPAAEDLRQGADGKEEVRPGGNPPGSIPDERAAGDDAVDVDMLREGLPPGWRTAVTPTSPPR
jgi:hypothetical protein